MIRVQGNTFRLGLILTMFCTPFLPSLKGEAANYFGYDFWACFCLKNRLIVSFVFLSMPDDINIF